MVIDGHIKGIGLGDRCGKRAIEVHEVVEIRSLRQACPMQVVGTGQECHGMRQFPREMRIDIDIGEVNPLLQAVGIVSR